MTEKILSFKDYLERFISIKTLLTTVAGVIVVGVGISLLSSFKEVRSNYESDHNALKLLVPAVNQLKKADSLKSLEINIQNSNIQLIKLSQDHVSDDVKELKGLLLQILTGTNKVIRQTQ